MLLCLHEEAAVAIAHGYAKVTGQAMAAAVHSNVGLFHATMAIFNAWCDRMPILMLGATGPVDAVKRRPWIDWIHTARDQGAIVRNFTKWDDQPASPAAARESVLRACWIANTAPQGPIYINLDAELQEAQAARAAAADRRRAASCPPVATGVRRPTWCAQAADMLQGAKRAADPGRPRVAQRGRLEAAHRSSPRRSTRRVATNLKIGAAFPTDHPLHVAPPATFASDELIAARASDADVILSLDWVDLGGTFKAHRRRRRPPRSSRSRSTRTCTTAGAWTTRACRRSTCSSPADPDADRRGAARGGRPGQAEEAGASCRRLPAAGQEGRRAALGVEELAPWRCARAVGDRDVTLTHVSLSWHGEFWPFRHPLDYVGSDGGGGVGGGPGISVGAALALKGTGRLPIAVCGDGDFLMGSTAVWTAVHYRIPAPVRGRQQSLVLQRRGAPGAGRGRRATVRSTTSGSASAWAIRRSTSPDGARRRAPRASARSPTPATWRRRSTEAIAAVEDGARRRGRCAGRAGLWRAADARRLTPQRDRRSRGKSPIDE